MIERDIEQEFESSYLKQTICAAKEQLLRIESSSRGKKTAIISSKKDFPDDSTHHVTGLWSSQNFDDLVELSQNTSFISGEVSRYEMEVKKIFTLEKMLDSPYFARIDFKFDDEDEFEKIYIGISSLTDDKSGEMYVYDWRAPISSIFYRFGTGKAFYHAPSGKITGEVCLKRQYEIKKGILKYFFDADIQITDEFLRKLLSQNSSAKMKTIVETIQSEQDIIIRDMETDLLMVQGVAGSGKTSVALHRVAYLMYRGLTNRLSPENILIVSPNTLFEQYISNVLPELGESNIKSVTFEDIAEIILESNKFQPKNQLMEQLLSSPSTKNEDIRKSSMAFKSSNAFITILNRFIADIPKMWIDFKDVYYDGKIIVGRDILKSMTVNDRKNPLLSIRLKNLEQFITAIIHSMHHDRIKKLENFVSGKPSHKFEVEEAARMLSIRESTTLIKEVRKFTELNLPELYKKLFSNKNYFYSLSKSLELPGCIDQIIDFTLANLHDDLLQYEDALSLAFLHLKIYGRPDDDSIRHVVIDEIQDYYPIHFEILNLLFPWSRFTVLGDINQTIAKQENLSLYEQIETILNKKSSTLITMDKSFRCTKEILEFSTRFLNGSFELKSFSREGDFPVIYSAKNEESLENMIIEEIMLCREKEYGSISLICKNARDSLMLYERLKGKIDIQLIRGENKEEITGTFIIPIYMSKGLEFDSVLICDADAVHYSSAEDKNLLYIASTRALHRLKLFHTGEMSPLLQEIEGAKEVWN